MSENRTENPNIASGRIDVLEKDEILRQFGIRLEQRELLSVFNTVSLNGLWFVVEETICAERSNEVHQKLLTDLCLECTRFPLSFSRWLMHSMIYLFLSIILSHSGISLFFMLLLIPVTRCIPSAKSASTI